MDGHDWNVWYAASDQKMVIGNVKAMTERAALSLAKKTYGSKVTVTREAR